MQKGIGFSALKTCISNICLWIIEDRLTVETILSHLGCEPTWYYYRKHIRSLQEKRPELNRLAPLIVVRLCGDGEMEEMAGSGWKRAEENILEYVHNYSGVIFFFIARQVNNSEVGVSDKVMKINATEPIWRTETHSEMEYGKATFKYS